ncbi:MAG: hypothetical protein K9L17_00670 [Clostridiales bacterium]|nr:hypothetical protein [Clostridiales bacterium]MCF8021205.1 hypothetical protein [Clostridiales bacterium]
MSLPAVISTSNASGAVEGVKLGYVITIVDVIDMSTTSEALIDAGAAGVFGASPDSACPPVPVSPEKIGQAAGEKAVQLKTDVVLVTEPRTGDDKKREENSRKVKKGIKSTGARVGALLPNLGAETPLLCNVFGRIAVITSSTGGAAYDAAFTAGARGIVTGTVARTLIKKGKAPAEAGAKRALELAKDLNTGIAVVAASSNSMEDILATQYISSIITGYFC